MSIFNLQDDAKALQPLVDAAVQQAIAGLTEKVVPALQQALDGLTVTVTIAVSKKP